MLFDEPEVYAYLEEINRRSTTVAAHERVLEKERVLLLDKLPSDAGVEEALMNRLTKNQKGRKNMVENNAIMNEELKNVTGGDWDDEPAKYAVGDTVRFYEFGEEHVGTIYSVYKSWGLESWAYGIEGNGFSCIPVRQSHILGYA